MDPVFTDLDAVPIFNAALKSLEDHSGYVRWRDGTTTPADRWSNGTPYTKNVPVEMEAAVTRINSWEFYVRWAHGDVAMLNSISIRSKCIDALISAISIAEGRNAKVNTAHQKKHGYVSVFLSPDEQALIEAHRNT